PANGSLQLLGLCLLRLRRPTDRHLLTHRTSWKWSGVKPEPDNCGPCVRKQQRTTNEWLTRWQRRKFEDVPVRHGITNGGHSQGRSRDCIAQSMPGVLISHSPHFQNPSVSCGVRMCGVETPRSSSARLVAYPPTRFEG